MRKACVAGLLWGLAGLSACAITAGGDNLVAPQ